MDDMDSIDNLEYTDKTEDTESRPQGTKEKPQLRETLISWGKTILVALAIALFIKNFLIVNAAVISGSMERTIMTGDRVICNRIAYVIGDPERLDVIAFNFMEEGVKRIYLKRIIGLPGEKVRIVDGKVYIDDSADPLPDDFVNGVPRGDFGPYEVPEDCYFVMGDNRNSSYDSKSWEDPFLQRDQILGKALFRYYPSFKGI